MSIWEATWADSLWQDMRVEWHAFENAQRPEHVTFVDITLETPMSPMDFAQQLPLERVEALLDKTRGLVATQRMDLTAQELAALCNEVRRRRPDRVGEQLGEMNLTPEALKTLDAARDTASTAHDAWAIKMVADMLRELQEWRSGQRARRVSAQELRETEALRNLHEVLVGIGWKPPQ